MFQPSTKRRLATESAMLRAVVGLLIGLGLVYIDNYAFDGETSPIVIVGCLFVAVACVCAVWGAGAWIAALFAWAPVPAAHVLKHVLGMRDTLQPNTYTSIGLLAACTLAVATVGGALGLFGRIIGRGSN